MSVSASSSRYRKAPLDLLLKPRDGEVYVDRWWLVDSAGDPLFFAPRNPRDAAPQCNGNKMVLSKMMRGQRMEFLPLVFLGPRDDEAGWAWLASQLEPVAKP